MRAGWEHFLASILLAVVFPMTPLVIELHQLGSISESSALIASVMYCSSIAIFSGNLVIFGLGFIVSVIMSVLFGASQVATMGGGAVATGGDGWWVAVLSIAFFALTHAVQRYDLHVVKGENFMSFRNAS